MKANGCTAESEFYNTQMNPPPLYAAGFLVSDSRETSVTSQVVRCRKDDGLYLLFVVENASDAVFGCPKLVKYPFPEAKGGIIISSHEISGSSLKPVGASPALDAQNIKVQLYGLTDYHWGEPGGVSFACVNKNWYKVELD